MRLGLIADTHGLLRPSVHDVFSRVDRILHAGDVGDPDLLVELELLAPVTAVYGNVDERSLRRRLPQLAALELEGLRFVLTHGDQLGSPTPETLKAAYPEADVIVFGHTHVPLITSFPDFSVAINPGSAGAQHSSRRPTVAVMELEAGLPPRARLVELG